jgi:hypothetical protein
MRRGSWPLLLAQLALLPLGWPGHFGIGVSDAPNGAKALHARAPVDFRYQYLAGGVNTNAGWATWNPNGTFVSRYVRESVAARVTPVFTYYQLLQSRPAAGGAEDARDLSNLRNAATMRAYWKDLRLAFVRARQAAGHHLVVFHIEPDLWGYLMQHHATTLARSFARHVVALRNQVAPRIALGWHMSVWGTGEDPTYSNPSLAHMRALGDRLAAFYRSLHANFDVVFADVDDRDAGFNAKINGDPNSGWNAADYRRHDALTKAFAARTHRAVVLWQVPLGNASLNNTWEHFRDNRVQWWLGNRAHLAATAHSGVVALLFGGGATGTTSPQTDGGLFYRLARAYYRRGTLPLP